MHMHMCTCMHNQMRKNIIHILTFFMCPALKNFKFMSKRKDSSGFCWNLNVRVF